jgi:hypothetical protein
MPTPPPTTVTPLHLVVCPHCQTEVPNAHFCGVCGAHLLARNTAAARRYHAYAAFPEEPVLRLSISTSLFPHLSHHSKVPFRLAVALLVTSLVTFALVGLEAPVIGVAATGVPLLFVLYLLEVDDPATSSYRFPVAVALLLEASFGVAWGIAGGHVVNRALLPSLNFSLTSGCSLIAAILVPCGAVLLLILPSIFMRARGSDRTECLDGFVIGAAGALGFCVGATVTQLSSLLKDGQVLHQPFVDTSAEALIRGVTTPVTLALMIGLVGSTLLSSRTALPTGSARSLGSPWVPILTVGLIQVGLGFADLANLGNLELLIAHVGALVIAIVVFRICLHHLLLGERHVATVGSPCECSHCHHIVPIMGFCPQCGVARRATSPSTRARSTYFDEDGAVDGEAAQ